MNSDRKMLEELLRLIDRTAAEEIDCEEFLHRAAALAESRRERNPHIGDWSLVQQHMAVCPECREEFEELCRLLEDPGK